MNRVTRPAKAASNGMRRRPGSLAVASVPECCLREPDLLFVLRCGGLGQAASTSAEGELERPPLGGSVLPPRGDSVRSPLDPDRPPLGDSVRLPLMPATGELPLRPRDRARRGRTSGCGTQVSPRERGGYSRNKRGFSPPTIIRHPLQPLLITRGYGRKDLTSSLGRSSRIGTVKRGTVPRRGCLSLSSI